MTTLYCLYLHNIKIDSGNCFSISQNAYGTTLFLYFGIFVILFTCNVIIHVNHETGYFPLMTKHSIRVNKLASTSLVKPYQGKSSTEQCTENIFLSFPRKNELSTFNDRYLHCDTNRVLGLNIRYRSINNEFR